VKVYRGGRTREKRGREHEEEGDMGKGGNMRNRGIWGKREYEKRGIWGKGGI